MSELSTVPGGSSLHAAVKSLSSHSKSSSTMKTGASSPAQQKLIDMRQDIREDKERILIQKMLPVEISAKVLKVSHQTGYEAHKRWFLDEYVPGGGLRSFMELMDFNVRLNYGAELGYSSVQEFVDSHLSQDDEGLLAGIDLFWGITTSQKDNLIKLLNKVKMVSTDSYCKDDLTQYKADFHSNLNYYAVLQDASQKEIVSAFYSGIQPLPVQNMIKRRVAADYESARKQLSDGIVVMNNVELAASFGICELTLKPAAAATKAEIIRDVVKFEAWKARNAASSLKSGFGETSPNASLDGKLAAHVNFGASNAVAEAGPSTSKYAGAAVGSTSTAPSDLACDACFQAHELKDCTALCPWCPVPTEKNKTQHRAKNCPVMVPVVNKVRNKSAQKVAKVANVARTAGVSEEQLQQICAEQGVPYGGNEMTMLEMLLDQQNMDAMEALEAVADFGDDF